jgi:hypothetical protein
MITTYHPVDHTLKNIVFNNWDMLGKRPTTSGLHEKKLRVGYRRPKNLKDNLVTANLPYKAGDQDSRPTDFPPLNRVVKTEPTQGTLDETLARAGPLTKLVQKSIKDFFPKTVESTGTQPEPGTSTQAPRVALPLKTSGGTPKSRRGFNFCNTKWCRYCPKLNKDGFIQSHATGERYRCMTNISCRSSNLIYCITCK